MILKERGYSSDLIDNEPVFWTLGKIGSGKLWCPSEWVIKDLAHIEKEKNDLVKIRWCFNAKPDLLIVSGKSCVFLELKVESGAGSNEHGYDQIEIQKLTGHYMKLLIPAYNDCSIYYSSLTLNNEIGLDGITWSEVINILEKTAIISNESKYVYKCLSQLKRYYVK